MNEVFIGIVIVYLIFAFRLYERGNYTQVRHGDRNWYMVKDFRNRSDAAALLDSTNSRMIKFMRFLRQKYRIDEPDDQHDAAFYQIQNHPGDLYNIVGNMINNYNPDVFYEKDPRLGDATSYTTNKGEKMHICVRNKEDPNMLVDKNMLLFVMLHESSHIANYNGWGHGSDFWATFKFILHEAAMSGVYTPVDYAKFPQNYCGLIVNYQPLYDENVPNIWE